MNTVQMLKSGLLDVILQNREGHRAEFETAMAGFQKTAVAKLEEQMALASGGLKQGLYIVLALPEDHTKDYDRAIAMLRAEVRETVELTQEEFVQYVQDDWGWKRQWTLSNSGYIGAAR